MSATFTPLARAAEVMMFAYGLSHAGDFIAGEMSPIDGPHGRGGVARLVGNTWKVASLPVFPSIDGHASPAFGVNGAHTVVGSGPRGNPATDVPYSWSPSSSGKLTSLGMFPGDMACIPYGVSASGKIAVGYGCTARADRFGKGDPFQHALVWFRAGTPPKRIAASQPPLEEDVAVGISSSGGVVVGFGCTPQSRGNLYDPLLYSRGHEPILWIRQTPGAYQRRFLPSLKGFAHSGRVLGLNDDGDRLVGFVGVRAGSLPVCWTVAASTIRLKALDNLPGYNSGRATAISSGGNTIAGNCLRGDDANFEADAFIWDPAHRTRRLVDVLIAAGAHNVDGWNLFSVTGLSSDGTTLCGTGMTPKGDLQAWVAQLS